MSERLEFLANNLPIQVTKYSGGSVRDVHTDSMMSLQPYIGREYIGREYIGREDDLKEISQCTIVSSLREKVMALTRFGAESSEVIMYCGGWMSECSHGATKLEIVSAANGKGRDDNGNLPLVLSLPTSALRQSIAQQMAKTGSFAPLAEEVASIVDGVVDDYDSVTLLGYSFGSRLGAALPDSFAKGNLDKMDSAILSDPLSAW